MYMPIHCIVSFDHISSGSGFVSSRMYNHGFFSAMIKLPSDYTAGICVAFYVSSELITDSLYICN